MTDEKATATAAPALTGEAVPGAAQETPGGLPDDVRDCILRVTGLGVALLATLITAFVELELSALRTGAIRAMLDGDSPWAGTGAPLPVAVPLTVVANLAIAWFAVTTTGRRWAAGPPWALWTLFMLGAAGTRTSEGDYLVGGTNWVALATILAGSLTFAWFAYRMILAPVTKAKVTKAEKDSELPGSF